MNIWIKELENELSINDISPWLKEDVSIHPFTTTESLQKKDIIIISKYDSVNTTDFSPYTTLIYEDIYQKIMANIKQEFDYAFDYYYLKNAIEHAKQPDINTIITGSSYSLFGIEENMLQHEVNVSLASQDLHYSLDCIYDICKANQNIKNIVFCLSYYSFFIDLSLTQNPNEILRISKVYEPLFHDIHNCKLLPPRKNFLFKSEIFDIQNILDQYSDVDYKNHYFNIKRPRKNFATKIWLNPFKNWNELTEREKIHSGFERASMHNHSISRETTLLENKKEFETFIKFCATNNIRLHLVVPPASSYYRSALDSQYKKVFYDIIDGHTENLTLLDLFDDPLFLSEDYNDMDHLGDSGALKMTLKILESLHS